MFLFKSLNSDLYGDTFKFSDYEHGRGVEVIILVGQRMYEHYMGGLQFNQQYDSGME